LVVTSRRSVGDDEKFCVVHSRSPREIVGVEGLGAKIGPERMKSECPFLHKIFEDELIFRQLSRLPGASVIALFTAGSYDFS